MVDSAEAMTRWSTRRWRSALLAGVLAVFPSGGAAAQQRDVHVQASAAHPVPASARALDADDEQPKLPVEQTKHASQARREAAPYARREAAPYARREAAPYEYTAGRALTAGAQLPDAIDPRRGLTIDVAGAGLVHRIGPPSGYCDGFVTCASGGAVPGGLVAMRATNGRLALSIEVTSSRQISRSREHPLYDEEFVFRASRGSVLAGYRFKPRGRFSYSALGGISETVGDAEGVARIRGAVAPLGGRYLIDERKWALGFTGGGDVGIALGPRLSMVAPVRVNWTAEGRLPGTWPSKLDIQAGIGLSFRVFRRIR